jgi:fructokinase
MISEMGNDRVGDLIEEFMEENGVGTGSLSRYEQGQSAIALAFLNSRSDAEYQFYKDYPHQRLNVPFPKFKREDMLLFGSFYALNPGIRPRVETLLETARQSGMAMLYDPNFRSSHLAERDELIHLIIRNMEYASVVRASDEDLENIFEVVATHRRHIRVLIVV